MSKSKNTPMLDSSFPLFAEKVDCTQPRRCETCRLWQKNVTSPSSNRSRCACPVPSSVIRATKYSGYTHASDGELCPFWHPVKQEEPANAPAQS